MSHRSLRQVAEQNLGPVEDGAELNPLFCRSQNRLQTLVRGEGSQLVLQAGEILRAVPFLPAVELRQPERLNGGVRDTGHDRLAVVRIGQQPLHGDERCVTVSEQRHRSMG